jgi:GT2 family glycosyltransferase
MDVSLVTVTWNSEQFIGEQLQSVFASAGVMVEVFVVDNASSDETVSVVRGFPQVTVIANEQNRGFAAANNQAIARTTGRYVVLLNPDMRLHTDTLATMVAHMDAHPEIGVLGPRLVDARGETMPHVRRFPGVTDQAALLLKIPHLIPSILRGYLRTDFDYTKDAYVDSVRGSCFMIRKEVIEKIGGLDERYFIWFEEVDYCKQVIAAGWKVAYFASATCVDYVGRSFALVSGFRKQRYFTTSMVQYFRKWHPGWRSSLLALLRPVALFAAWCAEFFRLRI